MQKKPSDATEIACDIKEGGSIKVANAWVRATSSPNGVSAAFFDVCNQGSTAAAIQSITSTAAAVAELHTTVRTEDGVVRMQPLETLVIASGAIAEFSPGNDHVMLIGLKEAIEAGSTVPVTLTFDNGETVTIDAIAKTPGKAVQH
ncbi:MAG: copper chaperone PCu(A)C [Pseudomonadota bacterium]